MSRDQFNVFSIRHLRLDPVVPPHPIRRSGLVSRPAATDDELAARDRYMSGRQRYLDIAIALAGLGAFAVVLPLVALAIKLDSPGPVFFSQERIGAERRGRGLNRPGHNRRRTIVPGRPFQVWKLRTMRTDAEAAGPRWAAKNDDRVTPFGRLLRRSRLDEVPQFWNVLRGEMSVVGPRPERLHFIRQLEPDVPHYRERLRVRPGITGLAQIENGYDTDLASVRRKVLLDRRYVEEAGLRTDLAILMRTVKVVFKGSGAH